MKKLFLLFAVMIFLTGVMWGQETIFSVSGGGSLPSGWSETNNIATNTIDKTSYYLVEAGSPGDLITTTSYDLAGYTSVTLNLQVATFGSGTANPAKIEVSTDGGSSYTQTYTSSTPSSSTYIAGGPISIATVSGTTVIRISNNGTSGRGVRLQNIILTATPPAGGTPTKLVVTSINSGSSPSANTSFDIVVQSKDNSDVTQNVSVNTDVTLSLETGSGNLGGTLSGTINAGENSVTFTGITYDVVESGVSVTATRTGGDALSAGTSSTFTVLEAATKLIFVNVPTGGQQSSNLSSFTVEAQRSDNSVDLNYISTITVAKASGSGNISGTLAPSASAGVATFSDVQFDAGGTYTISASASGLTGATSGTISILSTELPLVEDFDYTSSSTLTSNGWSAHSGGGTNAVTVNGSGLTYSNYASSGVGNAASISSSGEDVNRLFTQQTTGDVYVSFMVNVSSVNTTGDYFFHVSTNPLGSFSARVFAKDDGGGNLVFGIAKSSTAAYTTSTYTYNTTHLIVVKYTFNGSTTDDVVGIYVNPIIPDIEPVTFSAEGTTSETDASGIGAFAIRQGNTTNAPSLVIDGIRVATSWNAIPLPVELTSFSALARGKGVELAWQTATEVSNHGFEVERKPVRDSRLEVGGSNHETQTSNQAWSHVGFVQGSGTTNAPKEYSFTDKVPVSGKYLYRLKQVDNDGKFEYSSTVEVNAGSIANGFELAQNHPNPFNPTTNIAFALAKDEFVSLKVYDMLGKEIATLVKGKQSAGAYTVPFEASQLPSGIYFYTLRTNTFSATKKMLLVK